MLHARNLSKFYSRPTEVVKALEDVSLTVAEGEFVAVQGPSGCGKTTLLLMCGGLLKPDAGLVEVGGQDNYALSAEKRAALRAATVGFVFQQFHLIPFLTVLENILAPTLALPAADASAHAEKLIAHFNLTERRDHLPADLSTGERQRTALARALMNRPKLLLADEPTGNLDLGNAEIVMGYLAEFAREGGAVLLVTHDPRAADFAHRTLAMDHGRLRGK